MSFWTTQNQVQWASAGTGEFEGAQRAMAGVMWAVCVTLAVQSFLSSTDPLHPVLVPDLPLMAVWESFPLQKSSGEVLTLLLESLTQPGAAGFVRSMENPDLQCTVRVAAGAAVLLPEALPALKNWNVTNRPLLFFGEPLNCWLVYI